VEDGGCVAALIDAVARRVIRLEISELLRCQALYLLLVTDVDTERPATRQIVVDHLKRWRNKTNGSIIIIIVVVVIIIIIIIII